MHNIKRFEKIYAYLLLNLFAVIQSDIHNRHMEKLCGTVMYHMNDEFQLSYLSYYHDET